MNIKGNICEPEIKNMPSDVNENGNIEHIRICLGNFRNIQNIGKRYIR